MKTFALVSLAALTGLAVLSAGAHADPYRGFYVGVQGGYADLETGRLVNDVVTPVDRDAGLAGGIIGFRGPLNALDNRLVVGIEGNANFITNESDWNYGVSGIAGFRTSTQLMFYGRVGYERFDGDAGIDLDGIGFGGGLEYLFRDSASFRLEYRYVDYENNAGRDSSSNMITVGLIWNF